MNILMDIFVNFNPSQELFEMMRDQLIKDYVNQLKNPHNILRQVSYFVSLSLAETIVTPSALSSMEHDFCT